ncbi:hypothetical protein CLF_110546 [Clonorchis sinensis]|uniref:Uncharacterized protein n=1 Tax=Clonorchis sinensis TaxID=79923 RepID=G7YKU2_CLOSI|nr:hypothetical protein CLF_110546 [Clonorchis sinensis]
MGVLKTSLTIWNICYDIQELEAENEITTSEAINVQSDDFGNHMDCNGLSVMFTRFIEHQSFDGTQHQLTAEQQLTEDPDDEKFCNPEITPPSAMKTDDEPNPSISVAPPNSACEESDTNPTLTLTKANSLNWLRTGTPPLDQKPKQATFANTDPFGFTLDPVHIACEMPQAQKFASSTVPVVRIAPSYTVSLMREAEPQALSTKRDRRSSNRISGPIMNKKGCPWRRIFQSWMYEVLAYTRLKRKTANNSGFYTLDPVHIACEMPQAQKFASSTVPVVRIAPSYTVSLMREAEPQALSTKRDRRSSNRISGPIMNKCSTSIFISKNSSSKLLNTFDEMLNKQHPIPFQSSAKPVAVRRQDPFLYPYESPLTVVYLRTNLSAPASNAQLPTSTPQIIGERNCGSYNHCTASTRFLQLTEMMMMRSGIQPSQTTQCMQVGLLCGVSVKAIRTNDWENDLSIQYLTTRESNNEVKFAAELLVSEMNVLPAQIRRTDNLLYPDTVANKFQFSAPQSTPMAHYGTSATERAPQNELFRPDSIHISQLSSPHTPVRSSLENLKVTVNDCSSNDVANLYKRRCTSPFRGILKSNYSPTCTSLERPNGHPSMVSELNVEQARNSTELSPSRLQNGSNGNDTYSSNGTRHSVCDSSDSFCSVSPRSAGKSVRFADEIMMNGRISSSTDLSPKPEELQRSGTCLKETAHSEGPMVSVMSPKPRASVGLRTDTPDLGKHKPVRAPLQESSVRFASVTLKELAIIRTEAKFVGNLLQEVAFKLCVDDLTLLCNLSLIYSVLHVPQQPEWCKIILIRNKVVLTISFILNKRSKSEIKLGLKDLFYSDEWLVILTTKPTNFRLDSRSVHGNIIRVATEEHVGNSVESSSPIWSDQYKLPSLRSPTRLSVGVRQLPNNNGFINRFQETRAENLPNSSPLVCETPTLPPTSKFSGTPKLGYSDLLGLRLKKPTEGDQYMYSKERSIWAPSVNVHVIAPAICLAAGDTSGNTNGTTCTIRDNTPSIGTRTLNSQNVDNHYSQPNPNLDRKTFKPKILNSGKLNEFIQNLSNAKSIGIQPEEFGANCISYPTYHHLPSNSTFKNAGRTRKISPEPHNGFKHPGYRPGFQETPDYEGLDTSLPENGDLNNKPLTSFTSNPPHSVTSPVISVQKPPGTKRFSSVISQTAPHLTEQDLNRPAPSNAIAHISVRSCDRGRASSSDQRRREGNRQPQMLPTQDVNKAPTDSLAEFINSERACQRSDQKPANIFKPVSSRRSPVSTGSLRKPGSTHLATFNRVLNAANRVLCILTSPSLFSRTTQYRQLQHRYMYTHTVSRIFADVGMLKFKLSASIRSYSISELTEDTFAYKVSLYVPHSRFPVIETVAAGNNVPMAFSLECHARKSLKGNLIWIGTLKTQKQLLGRIRAEATTLVVNGWDEDDCRCENLESYYRRIPFVLLDSAVQKRD